MSPLVSSSSSLGLLTTNPKIVTNGLTLYLDASQTTSYTSGTTWKDLSGRGSDCSLTNSPTFSNSNGGKFIFNGNTQWGTCSGTPLSVNSYTKFVWFRMTNTASNNNIVSGSPGHFMFFSGTSTLYCGHGDWGNYNAYPSTTTFSTSTWYNACLTFNTTDGMTLYINGSLDSTYTALKTPATSGNIEIAAFAAGNLLIGDVAHVLVYNRSLSAAEVKQNYLVTKGRFGL